MIDTRSLVICAMTLGFMLGADSAAAAAPPWLRAQVGAPLPAHDDKTDAVLMYSEVAFTVLPNGGMKRMQREAYKILRPDGERHGNVRIDFDKLSRITSLHAWCIPAAGKEYEVKEKEAIESALPGIERGELMSDVRSKLLHIPAATPGNIIGYEFEQDIRPYMLADEWDFQSTVPVKEAHYTLQLPRGWNYKATWLNHGEASPTEGGPGQWRWTINDVKAVRLESHMPPWRGVASRMFVALLPPNEQAAGIQNWRDVGNWYLNLAHGRRDATPAIKQQVATLTASEPTQLQKMQALANFVQNNIRYVAVELGIGGFQPHSAAEVFTNRFGDCKDKATLLSVMLKEIGVDAYYVIINSTRGSVMASTPANLDFDHVILAVAMPAGAESSGLLATSTHPKLGKILFFDPTDELTPFGRLSGSLQQNFGVLVASDGGELLELPKLSTASNSIERTAQMTLDENGTLRGDITEIRTGDPASAQRYALRATTQDTDRIKPIEAIAAASFTSFEILKATIANFRASEQPFEWRYTVEAPKYAKTAGDLLLVRPRVLGSKTSGFLETKEPREHSIEFDGPERDKDVFEITLPNGYEVDELPAAVRIDEGFASYESKTEVVGRKIRYTRVVEFRDLSIPNEKAEQLKRLYRVISDDERRSAVLRKRSAP